jgi:hypothetical protein
MQRNNCSSTPPLHTRLGREFWPAMRGVRLLTKPVAQAHKASCTSTSLAQEMLCSRHSGKHIWRDQRPLLHVQGAFIASEQ